MLFLSIQIERQQQNAAPSDPRSITYTQQHSFCHLRVAFVRFLIHLSLAAHEKRGRVEDKKKKKIPSSKMRIRKVTNID